MLIIEINIRQIFCVSSIRIAQCYVRQFNILRFKRHVLWENVPDHKVGVTYRWSLMYNIILIHSVTLCTGFSVTKYFISHSVLHAPSGKYRKLHTFPCYL